MEQPSHVYVSAVKGHLVTRFGTKSYIGATTLVPPPANDEERAQRALQVGAESTIAWNENEVVAIPESEWVKYIREYTRCIKAKALTKRDKADYDKWLSSLTEQSQVVAPPVPIEGGTSATVVAPPVPIEGGASESATNEESSGEQSPKRGRKGER